MAKHLGINKTVISNWKSRGNNPPAEYLVPICEFLEISIYNLLGVEDKDIDTNEQELLSYYRKCNQGNKQIILNAAKSRQEPEQEEQKSSTLKIG